MRRLGAAAVLLVASAACERAITEPVPGALVIYGRVTQQHGLGSNGFLVRAYTFAEASPDYAGQDCEALAVDTTRHALRTGVQTDGTGAYRLVVRARRPQTACVLLRVRPFYPTAASLPEIVVPLGRYAVPRRPASAEARDSVRRDLQVPYDFLR